MSVARESTKTTDKKGNESYEWDSMSEEKKTKFFMDTIRDMYDAGDIDTETYQNANYDVIKDTISYARRTVDGSTSKLVKNAEALAYIQVHPDAVSDEQKKRLLAQTARGIVAEKHRYGTDGEEYTFKIDGKKVTYYPQRKQITGFFSKTRTLTDPQQDALDEIMSFIDDDFENDVVISKQKEIEENKKTSLETAAKEREKLRAIQPEG